ncbi:hypothetical protein SCA03_45130 [Streptomyces cacaoi]|uniref:ABC transporter n=2 Tax=Streptomyces TaxID=1883 RepID=A0A4Y3R360_STRCI|nr:hypothetical protein SCA03_45130 [Streptomyces cacaoi]
MNGMPALVRYTLATALHSQRYVAPMLLFAGLLGVLTVNGNGPLPPAYAASAGALFVCSTWLTTSMLAMDAPSQRAIVAANVGGTAKTLIGTVVAALLSCLGLLALGLLFPLWVGAYDPLPADFLLGAEVQLTGALAGAAVGVLCSRLVFRRQGYALVTALTLVLALLFIKGLPPMNLLLTELATTPDSFALIPEATAQLILSIALLVLSATVAHAVTLYRD